ncbi:MAG: UvrD-helicase domain-containing protein [Planctomycetota bacterium]|nr:UvrD-helicase domain-containing protein [Planctomycetota bacterium]
MRTNDGFLSKIIGLSEFLDEVISREKWYERAKMIAETIEPFASEAGERQKEIIAGKLQHIIDKLESAQRLYDNISGEQKWSVEDSHIKSVRDILENLNKGDFEKCAGKIRDFETPKTSTPKIPDKIFAKLIHDTAKDAVDDIVKLSGLAIVNPEYLNQVSGSASLQTKTMVELVRKFGEFYSEAKLSINCLDFADLEHYAMKLLSKEDSSQDVLMPSETAMILRNRYKYVFVDEYQDINPVHKAILEMVGSKGNIFVVGDIKQSIYAFRGAEPKIFLKHLEDASAEPKSADEGLRVDLNTNFRSSKGILDFVNKIFGRIMKACVADIDYDESAKLRPEKEASKIEPIVELHLLDKESKDSGSENQDESDSKSEQEEQEIYSARQHQAAMIAQRIKQMVGEETGKAEFEIFDKQLGGKRDVEYRDIVILMRSPAKRVNEYVDVLRLAGVPVNSESTGEYFQKTEIADLLSLLKVLDNPQRDIELAAILRSPFFKISDSALAEIKLYGRANENLKNFYDCVQDYSINGRDRDLAGELKAVSAKLEQWRTIARRGKLADLIWQIYRQTGYLSFVSALPSGQGRRANLLKLHERAIQFEGFASSGGIASLTRFVEFIEKIQEAGQDWGQAPPEGEVENAVRITSVHKSKGLEFPVVFLAELNGQFNKRDFSNDCIADMKYTLGLQIIDRQSKSRLSTLTHQVIAEEKMATMTAEEMRILYVATTRARERLILAGCEKNKNCKKIISKGFLLGDTIPHWQLRACNKPLDWILYALSDQKNLHEAFETGFAQRCRDEKLFNVKLYGQDELKGLSGYIKNLKESKRHLKTAAKSSNEKHGEVLAKIKKSLDWRYRFEDIATLPAKTSVSQLTHRDDEYVRIDYTKALNRKPKAVVSIDSGESIDGRLIGTATHLIIGKLDLSGNITAETIEQVKQKLLSEGAIQKAVAEKINDESIVKFFESQLGQKVIKAGSAVWREWPFSFAVPAVNRDSSLVARISEIDEIIVVQGIIDLLVQTQDGLLVIDFKTDNVTAGQTAQRAEFYRQQLDFYGKAAEKILKRKVTGKWLYFLKPGCAVCV